MILLLIAIFTSCIPLSYSEKNVVLILADDLDIFLDGMTPMKHTRKLIANEGATFSNCYVASPICCPNRASILTGKYQHNHLVVNNTITGGCNNVKWQTEQEPNTFATYLQKEKQYTTFYAGKYLNQYGHKTVGGPAHVPVGWNWWYGLIGNSKYYNYSLSINGTKTQFGNDSNDYLTDVINRLALDFIETRNSHNPFLMVLAPPAPHAPFIPATRHNNTYQDIKAKRTSNFNIQTPMDKHWLVQRGPSPLPDNLLPKLDEIYRRRWETLLAVDELVYNVYQALKLQNLLDSTYIIFTSDNGYHIGQFSMPIDKRQPYETDIKVPLLIRGPGIAPSKIIAPVSSVDLFATILEIAGIQTPSDGTSFLKQTLPKDRTLLIEYRGERSNDVPLSGCPTDYDLNLALCSKDMACKCQDAANNTFSCIRRISPDYNNIFCIFEDNKHYIEAYNITVDKYQMENIGYTMKRHHRYRFRKSLKKMSTCKNEECVVTNMELIYV